MTTQHPVSQPDAPQPMTTDEFVAFVRSAQYAVVATVSADGRPESALVEVLPEDDGALIFQSKTMSRKAANLAQTDRIALVIGTSSPRSLQIEGPAEQLSADEQAEIGPRYATTFPKRPPLGDVWVLFRVRPDWMRHYEEQPGRPPQVVEGLPR